jgi:hypothetical protein
MNCLSCIPNYFLFETVCIASCPTGFYPATMEMFTSSTETVNLVKNGDFSKTKCVSDWCLYPTSSYNNQVDSWIPDN